jgi:hypothetical protein
MGESSLFAAEIKKRRKPRVKIVTLTLVELGEVQIFFSKKWMFAP